MRMLFAFTGGRGHFEPLVALGRAARAAGHEVAFAAPHAMVTVAEGAGFRAFAAGPADRASSQRTPLVEPSEEREDQVLREVFAGHAARERAGGVDAVCESWRPGLIVREELDFGGAVAAERRGLPCATVLVNASGSFVRAEVVAEPRDALRAAHVKRGADKPPMYEHGEWRLAGADYGHRAARWRCPTGECKPASRWIKADRLHPLIRRENVRFRKLDRGRSAVGREFGR